MRIRKQEVLEYINPSGNSPFQDWLCSLKDIKGRAIIRKKINLLRLGYLFNLKSLGDNLFEMRIFFGPGYRIYFGQNSSQPIILLFGGNKNTQKRDIKKAKKYWKAYKEK